MYRGASGLHAVSAPTQLSPATRFRIYSVTKHFTCLAIMLLVEDSKASLQDSARRWVPELGSWADAITVEQVMAHRSGMRDAFDLLVMADGDDAPMPETAELALLADQRTTAFAPDERSRYCSSGYMVLGLIIERASGRSPEQFFADRLILERRNGVALIGHSGAGVGGAAQMLRAPGHDLDVAVLANGGDINPTAIAAEVLAICLDLPPPSPCPSTEPKSELFLCGSEFVHLFDRAGTQGVELNGIELGAPEPMEGCLMLRTGPGPLTEFANDQDGAAVSLVEEGQTKRFVRVEPVEPLQLAGRFWNDDARAEAWVEGATMTLRGEYGFVRYALEPRSGEFLRAVALDWANPYAALIRVTRDGFVMSTARTPDLCFQAVQSRRRGAVAGRSGP